METNFEILFFTIIWWCVVVCSASASASGASYVVDDSGRLGPRFDGIGGISGGGVSFVLDDDDDGSQHLYCAIFLLETFKGAGS